MPSRLTDAVVRSLRPPSLVRDSVARGLAIRVSSDTARTWVLCTGRRRVKLGIFPFVNTAEARALVKAQGATASLRSAGPTTEVNTVANLCEKYEREHLPLKSAKSQEEDARIIARVIVPALGNEGALSRQQVQTFHSRITLERGPVSANRAVAVLSRVLSLYAETNACRGVRRNREQHRTRYFTDDELACIHTALDAYCNKDAADAIRLMLLTGARPKEVLTASPHDFRDGCWHRKAQHMKARRAHSIPLSPEALAIVERGRFFNVRSVRVCWRAVRKATGINAPLYCVRHTAASRLVAQGVPLPVIARLLAHSSIAVTMRYAHVGDEQLREAVQKLSSRS